MESFMMIEKETEHKSAGNYAWFAERDARLRSAVNSSLYSDIQKIRAERVKLGLELVYSADKVYIEFRKKFISVKVNKPSVRDRKGLALLEMCYKNEGLEKCKTAQGITYRIFRETA
jgi:hypothetical protein